MVQTELALRKQIIQTMFNRVDATFPFQTTEDRDRFYRTYVGYRNKLATIKTDHDFFIFLEQFLASLHDSHTNLVSYPGKCFFIPQGCKIRSVGGRYYLFYRKWYIGKIVSIDGRSIKSLVDSWSKRIPASTKQYRLARIENALRLSEEHKPMNVIVRTPTGNAIQKTFPRHKQILNGNVALSTLVSRKIINKDVGYLKITTWNKAHAAFLKRFCDQTLSQFQQKHVRSVIIDVRGNQGGDSRVARHLAERLFQKKVLFAVSKTRVSKTKLHYRASEQYVVPRNPYVALPIILLVDALCHSSNEYFIAGLKDNRRAILIGQTTTGGSGNPKLFTISYKGEKLTFRVSRWREFRRNGAPLEGKGIKPDIEVKPTFNDLNKRRDIVLKRAIQEAMKLCRPHIKQ